MPKRLTKDAHFGLVYNPKTFEQAFKAVFHNSQKIYMTKAGSPFTVEAKSTFRGPQKGEKVIVFKQGGNERWHDHINVVGASILTAIEHTLTPIRRKYKTPANKKTRSAG